MSQGFSRPAGAIIKGSTIVSGGTAGRIPYETTNAVITDSADLGFDATDLILGAGIRARMASQNRFRFLNSIAKATKSADQTAIAVNTWTTMVFAAETIDTDTIHDTSSNNSRLTCKLTGKYLIGGSIYYDFAGVTTPALLGIRLIVDGSVATLYGNNNSAVGVGNVDGALSTCAMVSLTATQYVEVQGICTGASGTWAAEQLTGLPSVWMAYIGE